MDETELYIRMCVTAYPTIGWTDVANGMAIYENIQFGQIIGSPIIRKISYHPGAPGRIGQPYSQGQIQKMMMIESKSGIIIHILNRFYHFYTKLVKDGHSFGIMSAEQLWLMFYMHEKHKKIWDGKEWKEE